MKPVKEVATELAVWMQKRVEQGIVGMIIPEQELNILLATVTPYVESVKGCELDREADALYDVIFTIYNFKNPVSDNGPRAGVILSKMDYEAVIHFLERKHNLFTNALASFESVFPGASKLSYPEKVAEASAEAGAIIKEGLKDPTTAAMLGSFGERNDSQ